MDRATLIKTKKSQSISAIHDMCSIIQQHNLRNSNLSDISKNKQKALDKEEHKKKPESHILSAH